METEADKEGNVRLELLLPADIRGLRLDPAETPCLVKIKRILGELGGSYDPGWSHNGRELEQQGILYTTTDPQIVISGLKEAVETAAVKLKEAGARRVIPLNVSGPFHSYLLEEAGEKLGRFLENIPVSEPKIPYVANVTAAYVTKAEDVKPLLTRQVSSSVRWQQSVETMLADGVDRFIEIGPGKTLAGFIRKINREATVINIEKFEDLEKLN